MTRFIRYFIFIFCFSFIFGLTLPNFVYATVTTDNTNAIFTDDFASNAGVPTRSYLNTTGGNLQLTSAASQSTFTTPLAVGGSAISSLVQPVTIAKWGTLSIAATIPAETTLKIQILDDNNNLYSNDYLTGNSTGVASTSVDLSNIPIYDCGTGNCSKSVSLKIRYIMSTGDTGITPKINSVALTWTKTQGDLSATTLKNDHLTTYGYDQQRTFNTKNYLPGIYPTFKWVETDANNSQAYYNFFFDNFLWGYRAENNGTWTFKKNPTNSGYLSKLKYYAGLYWGGSVGNNNTYYGESMGADVMYAYDLNTNQFKWIYNFKAGHGNDQTLLRNDGTIYTMRQNNMVATKQKSTTLIAFNPDGTIKFQQDYASDDYLDIAGFAFSNDQSTIYFGTNSYDADWVYHDYDPPTMNSGKLYAINSEDGSVRWTYNTGNITGHWEYSPIVDTDGTIYIASRYFYEADMYDPDLWPIATRTKKLFAINPDGSLKWEKVTTDTGQGYQNLALRNDNVIMAVYKDNGDSMGESFKMLAISTIDGSTLWTRTLSDVYASFDFVDSLGGVIFRDADYSRNPVEVTKFSYLDKNNNLKWTCSIEYNYQTSGITYNLWRKFINDQNGDIYGSIYSTNNSLGFALKPWTLTQSSTIQSNLYPGDNMTFTAVTSMGTTNPLFGGDNQVQVYLDTGAVFPLSYSHTDSNGNTVWAATYYLPDNTPLGTHTYTVEASQAHLQTDIPTHFSSPSLESLNTGITATPQSFNVVQRNQQPSPDSNDHTCRDSKPLSSPDLFQINTNGNSAKLFFSPVPSMNRYYLSFSTKSNGEDYGADVTLAPEGVQNYIITQLKPNTTYYFKVRAQNGCIGGDWSNIFKVNTRGRGVTKFTPFFKKNQPKTNPISSAIIKKATTYTKKLTNSTPEFINSPKDTLLNPQSSSPLIDTPPTTQTNTPITQPTPTPKKFCILWWCL